MSEPMQADMTIGQLAKKHKTTLRTLRFYEDKGLISSHRHKEGTMRIYSPSDQRRFAFVLDLTNSGVRLDEVAEALKENPKLDYRDTRVRELLHVAHRRLRAEQVKLEATINSNKALMGIFHSSPAS